MASVHVQYNSGSEDSDLNDDFTGTRTYEGDDNDAESDGEGNTSQNQPTHDKSSDEDANADEHSQSRSGLADVISKILRKPVPKNKQVVLARGQTDREIQRKRKERSTDSEKKSEKVKKKTLSASDSDDSEDDSPEAQKKYRERKKQRKEWEDMARMKPDALEKDKERSMQKIATRGVVQLFNAVRQQQSMLGEKLAEVGSSERRREKVLGSANKKNFLTLLDGTMPQSLSSKSKSDKNKASRREDETDGKAGSWSILRDDFMMGAKMKDWDKAGDSDGKGGGGDDVVSYSD